MKGLQGRGRIHLHNFKRNSWLAGCSKQNHDTTQDKAFEGEITKNVGKTFLF